MVATMKAYYQHLLNNFGDELNSWLWPHLLNDIVDVKSPYDKNNENDEKQNLIFVGIGTLLCNSLPKKPLKIIFGTGAGYGERPVVDESWKIYCVRGPLTAQLLGIQPNLAITDPAVLVRMVDLPKPTQKVPVSFIPHISSNRAVDWRTLCNSLNICYIDPTSSIEKVLNEIGKSELIITEAMHGAILADALRIPWIPIHLSGVINSFKWQDWSQSMNVPYQPFKPSGRVRLIRNPDLHLPHIVKEKINHFISHSIIKMALKEGKPILSNDSIISLVTERLEERLNRFRSDFS